MLSAGQITGSMWDHNDPRVKKIVIDYAREQIGMTEILSKDYSELTIENVKYYTGTAAVVIPKVVGRWGGEHPLHGSIEDIVNSAILDLLTKEKYVN